MTGDRPLTYRRRLKWELAVIRDGRPDCLACIGTGIPMGVDPDADIGSVYIGPGPCPACGGSGVRPTTGEVTDA